jgi:ATP-dependent RNA helicase YTHDC2
MVGNVVNCILVIPGLAKEMGKGTTGRLNNGVPQVPPAKMHSELVSFQQSLPVYQMKDVITKAINDNRVLLISGETGSGKTTQVNS